MNGSLMDVHECATSMMLCVDFFLWHDLCVFKGLLFISQKKFHRRGKSRLMLNLFHLTQVFSFVCPYAVGTTMHTFLFAFWLLLCFSPSPSDQAAVYKNILKKNRDLFHPIVQKNCKTCFVKQSLF